MDHWWRNAGDVEEADDAFDEATDDAKERQWELDEAMAAWEQVFGSIVLGGGRKGWIQIR